MFAYTPGTVGGAGVLYRFVDHSQGELIASMQDRSWLEKPRYVSLSSRERDVLDGHLRGKTDREIARDLGRSVHTVSTISRTLRERFGMKMADIVAAVRCGDWIIRCSEDKFNLRSAIALLEDAMRTMHERTERLPRRHDRVPVRLHELELEALITLGRAVRRLECNGG